VCGRYTNTRRRSDEIQQKLADALGVNAPESERGFERFNIAPTDEVLAVVDDHAGRRIEELRWGLVPHWAKELKTNFTMINARAETLAERPAYRGLVERARHRCLVLADGWYEWPEHPEAAPPAAALLADGRRAVLLRRPLDTLAVAGRRDGPELHDRHLRGERARPADPRPHASGVR
jgi:putative SOS response-associated peptidase YedK